MPENTNKVIQLKDSEGNDVSPVVNVGSIYDKNGQKVDNLLSYTIAGPDVPVPELEDVKTQIQNELNGIMDAATLGGSTKEEIIASVPAYTHPSTIQCAAATEINNLKSSVSSGKTQIANAITGKGVTTSSSASFATMANNISQLAVSTKITGTQIETKEESGSQGTSSATVSIPDGAVYCRISFMCPGDYTGHYFQCFINEEAVVYNYEGTTSVDTVPFGTEITFQSSSHHAAVTKSGVNLTLSSNFPFTNWNPSFIFYK